MATDKQGGGPFTHEGNDISIRSDIIGCARRNTAEHGHATKLELSQSSINSHWHDSKAELTSKRQEITPHRPN